ncbi:hypothetical protein [Tsukamurella soli]|uniref:hypothetical protein n=1 Tax=Tsukamurella soli TaxID=644556 RepID=UPI0031EB4477
MIGVISVLVLAWLIIGAIAAGQRGYFTHAAQNCASSATTAMTVIAGPLNYMGTNPKVAGCDIPHPSMPQPSR